MATRSKKPPAKKKATKRKAARRRKKRPTKAQQKTARERARKVTDEAVDLLCVAFRVGAGYHRAARAVADQLSIKGGLTGRGVRKAKDNDPELAEMFEEAREYAIDHAEEKLYDQCMRGNVYALDLYLTNMRPEKWRRRGEKIQPRGLFDGGGPIEFQVRLANGDVVTPADAGLPERADR